MVVEAIGSTSCPVTPCAVRKEKSLFCHNATGSSAASSTRPSEYAASSCNWPRETSRSWRCAPCWSTSKPLA